MRLDFTVRHEGLHYVLCAESEAAKEWAAEHFQEGMRKPNTDEFVVEQKDIKFIIAAIKLDGLEVAQ